MLLIIKIKKSLILDALLKARANKNKFLNNNYNNFMYINIEKQRAQPSSCKSQEEKNLNL